MIWKTTLAFLVSFLNAMGIALENKKIIRFSSVILVLSIGLLSTVNLFAQIAPVVEPTGGFHIDGNLQANTPQSGIGDWLPGTSGTGGYVFNSNGTPVDPTRTFRVTDPYNSNTDNIFQGGGKFNDNPNTWKWTTGKATGKGDINNVLVHLSEDVKNDQWLILASDRLEINGTAYIDFELLQNKVTPIPGGTFSTAGPDGGRTLGDLLIAVEYTNGGSQATINYFEWEAVGSGYDYVLKDNPGPNRFGMTNTTTINTTLGAFGSSQYQPYQFVEAAINISAFFGASNPCQGITIGNVLVKTKASAAATAALYDFVTPVDVKLNLGTASIEYNPADFCSASATPVINGVQGGTFSSSTGLNINSSTGAIDLQNSTPGTYTINYAFTTAGCPKSVTVNVTIPVSSPLPVVEDQPHCIGTGVQDYDVTVTPGYNINYYASATAATPLTGTPTVNTNTSEAGEYSVWVSSSKEGECESDRLEVKIIVKPLPVAAIANDNGLALSCSNPSTTLTASGGVSYLWSTGETTASINVGTAGTFTVTVTGANGCTATDSVTTTLDNTVPTAAIADNNGLALSCNVPSTTLTASGGVSYLWSTGATTASINVETAGTFTITVTGENGCTATASVTTTLDNTVPAAAIANNNGLALSCNVPSTTLTASGGVSYLWSTGETTASINVETAGTFTVTVTGANGCSDTASVTTTLDNTVPTAVIADNNGLALSCNVPSTTLTASGGVSYLWSNGATTASINVDTAETFTVTVTGANGCTDTASVTTTLDNTVPAAAIANNNGLALSCSNPSTRLTASGGVSYSWSNGSEVVGTSASLEVTAAGTYTVTVTGENGCTATASVTTTVDSSVPVAAISNNNGLDLNCSNPSTTLTASGGVSYLWSTGATTASINVETAGTFTVTVTGANGCTATDSVTTTLDNTVPAAAIADNNGLALSCNVPSTTLIASGGVSYLWSTGETTASINVETAGTFTVTVTGANGCTATDSVTTTLDNTVPAAAIEDNNGLDLSCNVSSTTLTASGGVSYSWSNGSSVVGNSASLEITQAGTYTVMVTGENGCTAIATETVNFIPDTEAPVFDSVSDITVNVDAGICGATVNFEVPTATDNCEGTEVILTDGLASGSEFPVGTTTVTYTATDAVGNSVTTTFTVTVIDNEAPVIACLDNITQATDMGSATAVVTFDAPVGTDNCGATTEQTAGLPSGSEFPIGTTTNTYVVTDAAGNTATCSFTVTVVDEEDPTISCPANINMNVDAGICGAVVEFEMPVANDNSGNVTVTQTAGPASGEVFPVGTTTVSFTATDEAGNTATCSFTVTVNDNEAPVFNSVSDITVNVDAGICGATVNYEVPTASDNCVGTEVTLTEGLASGSEFPVGTTTVTYTATDAAGNTVSVSFTVTVIDNEAPVIACIDNISQATDTGAATAVVTFEAPVGTDNCGATTEQTAGLPSGSEFPIGTTTNTYVVTDAAGNTATCSFTVTVTDEEDPTITCPANINMNVDAGICGAVVEFEMPVANDNSGNVTVTQTAGPASGEVFPVGTTTVSFTATDESGNTATCSFTVTVNDNEAPVFNSVSDITVNVDAGICGATLNFEVPTATDNCAGTVVTLTGGLAPGSEFPVGTTTVTYTATDAAGNTTTISFTVTVVDNIAPVISCNENISVDVEFGVTSAVVTYNAPTATDNCPGTTIAQREGLSSGSEFPVGTTTNTFIVTDAAGNTATCSFTVTVVELPEPTPATPVIVEVVQPTCEVPTGTIEVETEEGLTYSINGTDYQESGFFSDLEPGTYSITARNSSGVVSEPVQVTLAEPSATLNITTFVELCNDLTEDVFDLFDLIAEGSDQTGTWMDTSQTGELNGSIIDPKNFAAGRYTFTYVVAGGCPSSTEVTVEIDRCFTLPCNPDDIKISKAVTPNSDGFNDFFMIDDAPSDPTCFTYNVKIFNRWGAEIFSAVNYNNNWDGQSNRSVTSSNQLPSGTYFYIVDVKDRSNGNHIKSIQSYIYLGTK